MTKEEIALTKMTIIQEDTTKKIRRALISGFQQPIYFGLHGGVKQFSGVDPDVELARSISPWEFA